MTDKKRKIDPGIKPLGKLMEAYNMAYVLLRDTLAQHEVGFADFVAWVVTAGRIAFVGDFLEPLLKQFKAQQRVRVINKTTIRVNLDVDPILPFDGVKVVANSKGGWVEVQKRGDGKLYINGNRMNFRLSKRQKTGTHRGLELKDELISNKVPVLHPNIMDALIDVAPHLIPDDLKFNDDRSSRYTFWWAVVYEGADGCQYVRFCYFGIDVWERYYFNLNDGFDSSGPAASVS